jgi:hypothetical protein
VFLAAADNNKKETVAAQFLGAVAKYGLPSRIRVDRGGENEDLVQIMEALQGPNRGSALQGRSVHNQRIERSWRDLWNNVSNLYHDLFYFFGGKGPAAAGVGQGHVVPALCVQAQVEPGLGGLPATAELPWPPN